MTCPQRKCEIRPNRCLTCEYCGGLVNGGVLCFKANRKLAYDLIEKPEIFNRRRT